MQCFIYKSRKKTELYLYLPQKDDFSMIPDALLTSLGALELVMQLDLTPDRHLAREKASDVIKGMQDNGFFIQMPPVIHPVSSSIH